MKDLQRLVFVVLLFAGFNTAFAQNNKIYISPVVNEKGIVDLDISNYLINNVVVPDAVYTKEPVLPVRFIQNSAASNDVLATKSKTEVLFTGEFSAFECNTQTKQVNYVNPNYTLATECYTALDKSPVWIRNDLLRQFRKLSVFSFDRDYALLINNAANNITDEVAFVIANMPTEALRDVRYRNDEQLIVRNAQFIYDVVDSLKYVRLVEHGTFAARDYYTTTEYRVIKTPGGTDTAWVEIPRDIYYWYVVHPKLQYEGVYSYDDGSNVGQRTYGYFWREFLWYDPSSTYDYRHVNKTNVDGTVDSVPRFNEIAKMPKVLWDRDENAYFFFRRPYLASNTALNIIGNWASHTIPVDATNPRTVQPNQCAVKHEGNCGEDSYLLCAAARTALIPCMLTGTDGEDHLWTNIWDAYDNKTWHHYEFFRGGLMVANQGWGFTSQMHGGSYEANHWVISMVNGYRPDTWTSNLSANYTDTCTLKIAITDKNGNAIDGARILLYCKPGPYSSDWAKDGYKWTDSKGTVNITVGDGKQYGYQVYHPKFGYLPNSTSIYILTPGNAVKGTTYKMDLMDSNYSIPAFKLNNNLSAPSSGDYGVHISWTANEIMHGVNEGDGQKCTFSYTEPDNGTVSTFLCDETNYYNFKNNQSFDAYAFIPRITSGNLYLPLPSEGKWYMILSNKYMTVNSQLLNATCELIQNAVISDIKDTRQEENTDIEVYPNPFNNKCKIVVPESVKKVEIFDLYGKRMETLTQFPFAWKPLSGLSSGIYIINASGDNFNKSLRVYYTK